MSEVCDIDVETSTNFFDPYVGTQSLKSIYVNFPN